MTIERKLLGTTPVSSGIEPEAVSFDGATDYLVRTSDLTSNTSSKTFTFSAWIYSVGESFLYEIPASSNYNARFRVSNTQVQAENSSGSGILSSAGYSIPLNTWSHILISIDLADTTKRHVYINDVDSEVTFSQYTNDNIDFTAAVHWIGARKLNTTTASPRGPDRKAHIFLDYTYRDLSVEANRRFFITSDHKPAEGQSSVDTAIADSYDTSGKGAALVDICFNDDGTRMLLSEGSTDDIHQLDLSTGFDLSTISDPGKSMTQSWTNYLQDIQFKDGGTKVYQAGSDSGKVHQYNLSTANDLSTASHFGDKTVSSVITANKIFISNDGSKMYLGNDFTITRWNLSTNYNVTTASHVNTKVLQYKMASIQLNVNGTEMYLPDPVADTMVTYTLSTAFDPTTASVKSIRSLKYLDSTVVGAIFNNDGSKLFVAGDNTNKVYEMLVGTNFDATTAVYGALQGSPAAPIVYLPMTDGTTAGSNSGTGGDFTASGILATAERGPNQVNCSAFTFNGTNDYLDLDYPEFLGDDILSGSFVVKVDEDDYQQNGQIIAIHDTTSGRNFSLMVSHGNAYLHYQLTSSRRGYHNATMPKYGTYVHIAFSVNAATEQGKFWVNGTLTGSFGKHNSVGAGQLANNKCQIAKGGAGNWGGNISEVWISNTAIDLDTYNPFWDSDSDKPNSVRKVIADTGIPPLIGLSFDGFNQGYNQGLFGNFNVRNGPTLGDRGPSEFAAKSVSLDGNSHLSAGGTLTGSTSSTTISFAASVKVDSNNGQQVWFTGTDSDNGLWVSIANQKLVVQGSDTSSGPEEMQFTSATTLYADTWHTFLFCIDLSNTSKRFVYIDGAFDTGSWTQYDTSASIEMNHGNTYIAGGMGGGNSNEMDGDIGFVYLVQSYIDFSQQTNRNKFMDQLNHPKDLTKQIDDGDIPSPLVYMKFDTSSLGTNSGTGGNFTIDGTVVAGTDVNL